MTVLLVVVFALVCVAVDAASAKEKYFIKSGKPESAGNPATGRLPEDGDWMPRTIAGQAGKKKNP
jgi:hypothetical protein